MASTLLDLYKLASEDDRSNAGYTAAELAGLGAAGFGGYQAYKAKKVVDSLKENLNKDKGPYKEALKYKPALYAYKKSIRYKNKANSIGKDKKLLQKIKDFFPDVNKRIGYNVESLKNKIQARKLLKNLGLKDIDEAKLLYDKEIAKAKDIEKNIKAMGTKAKGYGALAALGLATAGGAAYMQHKRNSE